MIKKQYRQYVSELEEDLIQILNSKGKFLIQAPPGGGKTYAIIQVFKKLSAKNTNTVYVIACPNKSQNEQNGALYKVYSIVGGKQINKGLSIASMVYDKAIELKEYLIKESKELVLVIDEAHQIIDSCNFREKALQQLQELESIAKTTIHLTATPSKLLKLYEYNEQYTLEPVNKKANIKEHTLSILFNDDILSQFLPFIKKLRDKTSKMPYIYLNSLSKIERCYEVLINQGYRVGIVANKDKVKDKIKVDKYPRLLQETENILNSIRNNAKLPTKDYDFIFATSIVECGISFTNTDIIHINLLLNPKDIDLDSGEQRSARPRKQINSAFTIIPDVVEQKEISCKDAVFKDVKFKVNKYKSKYQRLFDVDIAEFGLKYAQEHINSILSLETNKPLHYGALEVEEDKIVINQKRLIKAQFKEYEKQFFYNYKEFNKMLKQTINAEKFNVVKIGDLSTEEDKEQLKNIKEEQKEEKEILKNKAKEVLQEFLQQDTNLLREYINDLDILIELPKNIQDKIKILKQEESFLQLLKDLIKQGIEIKQSIEVILKAETKQQIKDYIKMCNYIKRNKSLYVENINDEYGVYRDVFDSVMKKRGRITKKKLQELTESLINYKIVKGKEKERYIKVLETLQKEKKISKANTTKLLKPFIKTLEMIYNISKDEKGYKITSLNKQI